MNDELKESFQETKESIKKTGSKIKEVIDEKIKDIKADEIFQETKENIKKTGSKIKEAIDEKTKDINANEIKSKSIEVAENVVNETLIFVQKKGEWLKTMKETVDKEEEEQVEKSIKKILDDFSNDFLKLTNDEINEKLLIDPNNNVYLLLENNIEFPNNVLLTIQLINEYETEKFFLDIYLDLNEKYAAFPDSRTLTIQLIKKDGNFNLDIKENILGEETTKFPMVLLEDLKKRVEIVNFLLLDETQQQIKEYYDIYKMM